jgi:DNA repair exonuclease SbcCD nuclease subunit
MLLVVPTPRRSLRVLHTADVHLESDGYGDARQRDAHRQRERRLFGRIVDRALADDVDLVLIAGDLFDHNRVPDEAVAFVRAELDRLRQPVVILPGNHDALCANSIYDRHDFTAGAPHVQVISRLEGQTIDLPALDAVVWGRAMEEHEPGFRPLAHLPGRAEGRWCLAMAHGFFSETGERPERSSPIFADEIGDSGWDYVALGHCHARMDVSRGGVPAHYAGAPLLEGSAGLRDGVVLRIDFSVDEPVRVLPVRV